MWHILKINIIVQLFIQTLLVYELYLQNKDSGSESGKGNPIKKIFIDKDVIEIDDTPIDKYGKECTANHIKNWLQENLDMPIDIRREVGLPNKIVASNAAKPYITIYGYINLNIKDKKGKKEISGRITLGDKKRKPYAELSFPEKEIEIDSIDTKLKINDSEYFTSDEVTLYEQYHKNQIIRNGNLPAELFEKIAQEFFKYILDKEVEPPNGKTAFHLYILPNNSHIKYVPKNQKKDEPETIDAFGETGTWSNKRSQGVTFFSYDDKAFTINCKEKEEFYKNVGINDSSLENIFLPEKNKINIVGFEWYFLNVKDQKEVFQKGGIYEQIYTNYQKLKQDNIEQNAYCKILCVKKTQAKREVLIDENLTMGMMDQIFKGVTEKDLVPSAYERLIVTRRKKSTYRYYIQAIKSLLNQTSFDREQLNKIFIEQIRIKIREWIKAKSDNEPIEWFNQFEFCYKTLIYTEKGKDIMDYEKFAENVGKMSREYITFRKKVGSDNNSLRDILTKTKYDRETLKFVVKTISRGIHLTNTTNKQELEKIDNKISKLMSSSQIDIDQNKDIVNRDMSYYFYLGYFRRQETN